MTTLVDTTVDAHGGLAHWSSFKQVSAHLVQGGALWTLKGQAGVLDETNVTVGVHEQWASHSPFGGPGKKTRYEPPHRVAIQRADGKDLEILAEPRASFAGHTLETPWTAPQLAYFAGCAMWTYLNTPFVLRYPDVRAEELSPWVENGETWRRLQVTFPPSIVTHSTVQTLYIGDDGLLRRHDYDVEIAGGTPGAHYISDYVEVSGIMFPTKRRIFPRGPDGTSMPEPLVVSIHLSDIVLS
jgi:hypothetical protein